MGLFANVGKAISSSFAWLGAKPSSSIAKPSGSDGVIAYGGYLPSDERRPELAGSQKWVTFSNATNTGIVATGLRRTLDMLAGTQWHAEPNENGGKDAQRAADLVTKGLISASLPKPWPNVVRKAAMYRYFGFSLHEWTAKRQADGTVIFSDISHRPQYTIDRWDKPSEQLPWQAVSQLTRYGNRYVIPRERLFYCVDDTLTDSPDGVGLMRHVIELVRRLGVLEGLEGLAFETDLRGMPVGRAPIGEMAAHAESQVGTDRQKIQAFVQERTQNLRSALQGLVKTPEKLQYLLLDSAPFLGVDQNTFAGQLKWGLDLLKGGSNGVDVVGAAIGRIQLEIARVLGIEFAMVGGGATAGTHGMHRDKTEFFATMLQTTLTEIAAFATADLARTLVGLNGLDPDTCTPKLVAEPISLDAISDTCTALQALAAAGLDPRDPAIPVIRERMHLPPPPEPTEEQLGLLAAGKGKPGKQPPPGKGAPPKPGEDPQPPDQSGPQGVTKYSPEQPRDGGGRWTSGGGVAGPAQRYGGQSGGGGGGGMAGGVRPWTLAFDSRAHQKTIDEHKRTETKARDSAKKVQAQISDLKAKQRDATDAQKAQIQRKVDRLTGQRDVHLAAAASARDSRHQAEADLRSAREQHAWDRKQMTAERRAAPKVVDSPEHAFTGGGQRIGSSEGHPDVAPTAAIPARHPESALERLSRQRQEYYSSLPHAPGWANDKVHEHTAASRAHDQAAADRVRAQGAAQRAAEPSTTRTPGAHELPVAQASRPGLLSRAGASLRRLISRKSADDLEPLDEIAKAYDDAAEALADLEAYEFESGIQDDDTSASNAV